MLEVVGERHIRQMCCIRADTERLRCGVLRLAGALKFLNEGRRTLEVLDGQLEGMDRSMADRASPERRFGSQAILSTVDSVIVCDVSALLVCHGEHCDEACELVGHFPFGPRGSTVSGRQRTVVTAPSFIRPWGFRVAGVQRHRFVPARSTSSIDCRSSQPWRVL
jgi:hypothetical protein